MALKKREFRPESGNVDTYALKNMWRDLNLGHFSLFLKYHRKYLRYRFRIDTTRKGTPSSTKIINKLCCHFIRYDKIRCQRHVVELLQPTPSRGRLGQYTRHVGTMLKVCVLRAHSQ